MSIPIVPNTSSLNIVDSNGNTIIRNATLPPEATSLPQFSTYSGTSGSTPPVAIAFVSAQYSSSEMGKFSSDVGRVKSTLSSVSPYNELMSSINFIEVKNTNDLSCYRWPGMDRCLVCDPIKTAQSVADAGIVADTIMVIVNNEEYGGCAWDGMNFQAADKDLGPVAAHELQHSLIGLQDEYLHDESSVEGSEDLKNCYAGQPPSNAWRGVVADNSYFQGCTSNNWYRSSETSLMRDISSTHLNPISIKYVKERFGILTGDNQNGGPTPTQSPTPTPPAEVGYCADHDRSNPQAINGATCGINNAEWVDRSNGTGSGYDTYCDSTYGNAAEYFYKCPAGGAPTPTVTVTPTPTPYQPLPEGGSCNPLQGTWQCEGGSYCSQACSSSSASCTTGRCCEYGKSWDGSACVTDPTPTQPPAAPTNEPATPTPSPIAIDACPDVNPGTNPPIFNVCRPSTQGCIDGEVAKSSQAAHNACSNFYGGSYLCCQRPPATTAAGSSCNLSPRKCDTSKNNSTGANIQCTGCGGYCVPDSTGQGICMNQYYQD